MPPQFGNIPKISSFKDIKLKSLFQKGKLKIPIPSKPSSTPFPSVSGALGSTVGLVASTLTSVVNQGGSKITLPPQAAELPPLGRSKYLVQ